MSDRLADILVKRLVRVQQREAMSGFERRGLVELTGLDEDGAAAGFRISATRDEVMEALASRQGADLGAKSEENASDIAGQPMSLMLRARLPEGVEIDAPLFEEALALARVVDTHGNDTRGNNRQAVVADDPRDPEIGEPEPEQEQQGLVEGNGVRPERHDGSQDIPVDHDDPASLEPWSSAATIAVIRAMRSTAEPPRPDELASMLLAAKAVTSSGISIASLLDILRGTRPIVVLISPVREVLVQILHLLERGLILPGKYELKEGRGLLNAISSWRSNWTAKRMITLVLERDDIRKLSRERMKEIVSRIMAAREPVLVVADDAAVVPKRLVDSAHLVLNTGAIDGATVNRTIEVCLGGAPIKGIPDAFAASLDLTDLVTAIRPGATPQSAIQSLCLYAAENDAEEKDDEEAGLGRNKGVSQPGLATTATEAIVIAPDMAEGPTIDTASGYGAAIAWAKELRLDLVDWKGGIIPWSEMSTRVLLAGPPGTGKTTFAKILGRSLGVPVLLTSPPHWLEPSHLGDVLKRMKKVFAEAQARAPAILFIDELDGLGTRMSDTSQPHASYHRNVIDQALLLIDGTGASEGVILVCATNRPEDLDSALIRSGRLELRIAIPLPDEEALAGIIADHVGDALYHPRNDAASQGRFTETSGGGYVAKAEPKVGKLAQLGDHAHPQLPLGEGQDRPIATAEIEVDQTASHQHLFRSLARAARGLSGADIERIVRNARQVARRARRPMLPADLIDLFAERHRSIPPDLRWRMAVHEAGHVVAHRALGLGEPISTYIDESGGVTITRAFDRAPTETELSKLLVVLLAGRAAEELVLGEVSAGAGGSEDSDLAKATTLACRMEAQFGFVTPLHYTDQEMARRLLSDPGFTARIRSRLDQAGAAAASALAREREDVEIIARRIVSEGDFGVGTISVKLPD